MKQYWLTYNQSYGGGDSAAWIVITQSICLMRLTMMMRVKRSVSSIGKNCR